jgi:hypothetical protein
MISTLQGDSICILDRGVHDFQEVSEGGFRSFLREIPMAASSTVAEHA